MELVKHFKYLGRLVTAENDDWMAICHNIKKARSQWAKLRNILKLQTSCTKVMGNFYKAVVQKTLLYGSETWNLISVMLQKLNTFHHTAVRHITQKKVLQRWES